MKTTIFTCVTALCMLVLHDESYAQLNMDPNAPVFVSDTSMTDLPCGPNIFYSVDNSGVIEYHQIGTSTITTLGTLMTRPFCQCLSVNDNFSGGNPNPTFYQDTMMSGLHEHRYYNASGTWSPVTPLAPPNMRLTSCGGYGPYLYFLSYQPVAAISQKIYRYDGISWQMIYDCTPSGRRILPADIGVDQNGNLIILQHNPSSNFISDSLYVISPTGQVLAQHAFQLDLLHAYGAMMINSVYYIGFGNQNPVYPDQLVPFYITSSSVIAGVPYPFTSQNYFDLASCEPGLITGVDLVTPVAGNLAVWPVPADDRISFENEGPAEWEIFTADGRLILNGKSNGPATINVEALSAGMYMMVLTNDCGGVRRTKFVIE